MDLKTLWGEINMPKIGFGDVETYIKELIIEEFGLGGDRQGSLPREGRLEYAPKQTQSDLLVKQAHRKAANDE